jgi:hypothetical protein
MGVLLRLGTRLTGLAVRLEGGERLLRFLGDESVGLRERLFDLELNRL